MIDNNLLTIAGAVVAGVLFFWDNIAALIKDSGEKIKKQLNNVDEQNSKDKKTNVDEISIEEIEALDQAAIAHLRDRAIELGDEALIELIKKLDADFYDIHVALNLKIND